MMLDNDNCENSLVRNMNAMYINIMYGKFSNLILANMIIIMTNVTDNASFNLISKKINRL